LTTLLLNMNVSYRALKDLQDLIEYNRSSQALYRFKKWTPQTHHYYPSEFKTLVRSILLVRQSALQVEEEKNVKYHNKKEQENENEINKKTNR